MRWSVKVAKIAGIEVRIHLTFLLLLAWIGMVYYRSGGQVAAVHGIIFIILIFLCVLLHEFGHALTARYFGIKTPDITLLPIGGVARMQRMPDKPGQELLVAVAGPLVNVVIAAGLLLYLGGRLDLTTLENLDNYSFTAMTAKLAAVNVILVLFNMIPAFPMDGGRVLRALLAMVTSYGRATHIAASIGQALAFAFGFVGLFFNPLLIFIALFVYLGAAAEARMTQMKELAIGLPVAEAMVTHVVSLPEDSTLEQAAEALLRTSQHEFPVLNHSGQVLGVLTRDAMIGALRSSGPDSPVTGVMQRDLPSVRPDDSFEDAFRIMHECECPALPVVNSLGQLVGLVTTENVGEMMLIQSVLPDGGMPAWRRRSEETQPPRQTEGAA